MEDRPSGERESEAQAGPGPGGLQEQVRELRAQVRGLQAAGRRRVRRSAARPGLVLLLVLAAAAELGSETLTMTTYYPAPAGTYQRLTTTGKTVLARDGGSVGIGTTDPAAKLHVNGELLTTLLRFPDGTSQGTVAQLSCRKVSARAVNSVSVSCSQDEALTSCAAASFPGPGLTCWTSYGSGGTRGASCQASCGQGTMWAVSAVCCKLAY